MPRDVENRDGSQSFRHVRGDPTCSDGLTSMGRRKYCGHQAASGRFQRVQRQEQRRAVVHFLRTEGKGLEVQRHDRPSESRAAVKRTARANLARGTQPRPSPTITLRGDLVGDRPNRRPFRPACPRSSAVANRELSLEGNVTPARKSCRADTESVSRTAKPSTDSGSVDTESVSSRADFGDRSTRIPGSSIDLRQGGEHPRLGWLGFLAFRCSGCDDPFRIDSGRHQ